MSIEEGMDAIAELLGLHLLPEHRPGVIQNFALLTAQAELFMEFELDERIEMAPVFRP
ncbi:MAG: DUF4089 domain-containing protein [Pseudomonadota bacterium]|nr:DUF4089 domain-containing protein [Pseudomonadota bacterium]